MLRLRKVEVVYSKHVPLVQKSSYQLGGILFLYAHFELAHSLQEENDSSTWTAVSSKIRSLNRR